MAEIDDRHDVHLLETGEGEIGELPVVAPGPEERGVDGRPVAQDTDVEIPEQLEIGAPMLVVAALLHLVDAGAAVIDGRAAVLDAGREHEERCWHRPLRSGLAVEAYGSGSM